MNGKAVETQEAERGFDSAVFLRALATTLAEEPIDAWRYLIPTVHATTARPGERAERDSDAQPV